MNVNPVSFKGLIQIGSSKFINTKEIQQFTSEKGGIDTKIIYRDGKKERVKAYIEEVEKAFKKADNTGETVKLNCWG